MVCEVYHVTHGTQQQAPPARCQAQLQGSCQRWGLFLLIEQVCPDDDLIPKRQKFEAAHNTMSWDVGNEKLDFRSCYVCNQHYFTAVHQPTRILSSSA